MMIATIILANVVIDWLATLLCLILFVGFSLGIAGLFTVVLSALYSAFILPKFQQENIKQGQKDEEQKKTANTKQGAGCSLYFLLMFFCALFFFVLFNFFPTKRFWNDLIHPGQAATTSQVAHGRYWVTTSSGKTHNSSCRYYANSKGHFSDTGTGNNCKICGGAGD